MTETPKTSIGGYAISRRLPGPGESYQARSPNGDRVLVRVLPRPADEQAWEQLKQDVAGCRRLDHPAIPKPSDVFEDGPSLVIVDQYFEGSKLGALMRRPMSRSKLRGAAAWHIARQLTGALALAHTAVDESGVPSAVCHGHLSPAQVLVSVDGTVRLEGLGFAALAGTPDAPAVPGFQPPEEAKGGRVTPRGDLYSAAVILWALLTSSDPPVDGAKLDLEPLESLAPPAVMAVLRLALEPSIGKRKITTMEVEEAIAEAYDQSEGKAAAAAAARALAQSGRTLVGTGGLTAGSSTAEPAGIGTVPGAPPAGGGAAVREVSSAAAGAAAVAPAAGTPGSAVLGPGMRRGPAVQAAAAEPAAAPKEPETPFVAAAGLEGIEPKAVARASVGGPKKGLRQRTLLGSWMNTATAQQQPTAAEPSAAPAAPAPKAMPSPSGATAGPGHQAARGAPPPHAAAFPPLGSPDERGTVESFDSVDLEAAMLGATVTADAPSEPPVADPAAVHRPTGGVEGTSSAATLPHARVAVTEPETLAAPVDRAADDPVALALSEALQSGVSDASEVAAGKPPSDLVSAGDKSPPAARAAEAGALGQAASAWAPAKGPTKAAASTSKPLSWGTAIAIALLTAIVTMAIGIWWTRRQVGLVEVIPPEPSVAASATAATTGAPSAGATGTVAGSAAAAASAAPGVSPDAGAEPTGGDGKDLPADRGLLRVDFSPAEGAEVFVYGKSYGPVGQSLDVPCGRRFIRVGKMPGPAWLSQGQSIDIACRSVTTVKLTGP